MTDYITNIGTEHHRELKRYKQAAGAKNWARSKLGEFGEWTARYNHELGVKVQEASKVIDNLNFPSLPPGRHNGRTWRFKDDHSGFTMVIEMWKEETDSE